MGNAQADGDDTTGIDDEDGVNLSKFVIGKESTIRVTASEAGYLRAWIDWNADGDFTDEGEMVIDSNVKDGTRAFKVPVPATDTTMTFARFRVSTSADDMGPFGTVPDGEVEDHMILISGKTNGGPVTP
jgi:hypothetical protein